MNIVDFKNTRYDKHINQGCIFAYVYYIKKKKKTYQFDRFTGTEETEQVLSKSKNLKLTKKKYHS